MEFLRDKDLIFFEELEGLGGDEGLEGIHGIPHIGKPPLLGFDYPGVGIVVAVEDDAVVFLIDILDDSRCFGILVFCFFESGGDFIEGLCRDRVESHVRILRSTGPNRPS